MIRIMTRGLFHVGDSASPKNIHNNDDDDNTNPNIIYKFIKQNRESSALMCLAEAFSKLQNYRFENEFRTFCWSDFMRLLVID